MKTLGTLAFLAFFLSAPALFAEQAGVSIAGFVESCNRILFEGASVDANRNTVDLKCTGGEEKC